MGEAPPDVIKAHSVGQALALQKPGGGIRPLCCGSVVRRLGARAACKAFSADLRQAVGPYQWAIGRPSGMEAVRKVMGVLAEHRPHAAFEVGRLVPELSPVARTMYSEPTGHLWWDDSGAAWEVSARARVDQGCPLSPCFFALAVARSLGLLQAELGARGPHAKVFAYLDDVYVVVDPAQASWAMDVTARALSVAGLGLNLAKSMIWIPSGQGNLSGSASKFQVSSLPCLGSVVPCAARAAEAADVETLSRAPLVGDGRNDGAAAALTTFRTVSFSCSNTGPFFALTPTGR